MPSCESLLRAVSFRVQQGRSQGTGFAITPRLLVTAAHVVRGSEPVVAENNGNRLIAELIRRDPDLDIAILQTGTPLPAFAPVLDDFVLKDDVYCLGFPSGSEASALLTFEGFAYGGKLIKLRESLIEEGYSGAPLLNLRTGAVCGIVIKSRDPRVPTGALAVSARALLEYEPAIKNCKAEYFDIYQRWALASSPLGILDLSNDERHYALFDFDNIDIEKLSIPPTYRRVRFVEMAREDIERRGFERDAVEILNSQHCLFLIGPYGAGKTLLTKLLQRHLFLEGYDIVFLRANELTAHFRDLEEYLRGRRASNQTCIVAFDGMEETNLLRKDKAGTRDELLGRVFDLCQRPQVSVIVNSRVIPIEMEEVYFNISMLAHSKGRMRQFELLELEHFGTEQIDNWLDAYSNELAKLGHEERLHRFDIRKFHKNLVSACKNPLFLYMLTKRYYEDNDSNVDLYSLYDSFVNATVAGKFDYKQLGLRSESIKEIVDKYRVFLRQMAAAIAVSNDIDFDRSDLESWKLDSNDRTYSVDYVAVNDVVDKTAAEILDPHVSEQIDPIRLRSNVLTCYFLEEHAGTWRFRDNNILFFLIAEFLCNSFLEAPAVGVGSKAPISDFFPQLSKLKRIPLNPVSVRMWLLKLKALPQQQKHDLQEKLLLLAKNRRQILDTATELRLRLLVYVAFLNLFEDSYANIEDFFQAKDFFQGIEQLAADLKQEDLLGYDILRAFFREIHMQDVVWRGTDFDEYNFNDSELKDVVFERCAFKTVLFDRCHFQRVRFTSCDLIGQRINQLSGEAAFEGGTVDLEIKTDRNLTLRFKSGTQIRNLHIWSDRIPAAGAAVDVHLSGVRADRMMFRTIRLRPLEIEDSTFPRIKVEGADVHFRIKDSKCLGKKPWQSDGQTKLLDLSPNR